MHPLSSPNRLCRSPAHLFVQNADSNANKLLQSRSKDILAVSKLAILGGAFSTAGATAKSSELIEPRYLRVEKVLCTPKMYPLIHKKSVSQITFTWRDGCSRVLDVLTQINKDNCFFGLKFTNFDP